VTDPQAVEKVEAVDVLAEYGPTLGRPLVDTLAGSTLANLKELRPRQTNVRVLFVFDPWRSAILLVQAIRRANGTNGMKGLSRRRIMAEQWGSQLAEQRKRPGFTQAGLAEIMGVTPGRVSQIERGEVSTVEALASCIAALGGKLELVAGIGGHLLKMPANPAA
jgi:DNA-binding XRE family transcriptional regulator